MSVERNNSMRSSVLRAACRHFGVSLEELGPGCLFDSRPSETHAGLELVDLMVTDSHADMRGAKALDVVVTPGAKGSPRALANWLARREASRRARWQDIAANSPAYLDHLTRMDREGFRSWTRRLGIRVLAAAVGAELPATVAGLLAPFGHHVAREVADVQREGVDCADIDCAVNRWAEAVRTLPSCSMAECDADWIGRRIVSQSIEDLETEVRHRLLAVTDTCLAEALNEHCKSDWTNGVDCFAAIRVLTRESADSSTGSSDRCQT